MKLYAELETGAECERLAPVVAALAAGEASPEALLELRPHLRNCAGCRATVRALHASRLRGLSSWVPIAALVAPARAWVERLRGGRSSSPPPETAESLHPMERQQELEEAFRRIDQGQAAVEPSVAETVGRASQLRINARGWLEAALQRLQSNDVVVGVHVATNSGGARIASLAALIGVCLSGVGAGTYCVATALLPEPKPPLRAEAPKRAHKPTPKAHEVHLPRHTRRVVVATPTPAPSAAAGKSPTRSSAPRPRAASTPQPAPASEFAFEAGSSSGSNPRATSGPASSASNPGFETSSGTGQSAGSQGEFSDGGSGEFSP